MTQAPAFGLSPSVISSLKSTILKNGKVEKIIIYGSRAKGTHRPGSDIDLTIVGPTLSTTDLLKIENEIDDLMIPYKVDLSLLHQIENPDLVDHITRVGVDF